MSDVELGDDESLTLVCAELRARNPVGGKVVDVRGDLEVRDRVWINVPDYYKKKFVAYGPPLDPAGEVLKGAGILGSTGGGVRLTPTTDSETGFGKIPVFVSASPPLSVFERLRAAGERRVDLREELALLRAAVLELYDSK